MVIFSFTRIDYVISDYQIEEDDISMANNENNQTNKLEENATTLHKQAKEVEKQSTELKRWIAVVITVNLLYFLVCFICWQFETGVSFPPWKASIYEAHSVSWSWFLFIYLCVNISLYMYVVYNLTSAFKKRKKAIESLSISYDGLRQNRITDEEISDVVRLLDRQQNILVERECENIALKTYIPSFRLVLSFSLGLLAFAFLTVFLLLQSKEVNEGANSIITTGIAGIVTQTGSIISYLGVATSRKDKMLMMLSEKDQTRSALIMAWYLFEKDKDNVQFQTMLSQVAIKMIKG